MGQLPTLSRTLVAADLECLCQRGGKFDLYTDKVYTPLLI